MIAGTLQRIRQHLAVARLAILASSPEFHRLPMRGGQMRVGAAGPVREVVRIALAAQPLFRGLKLPEASLDVLAPCLELLASAQRLGVEVLQGLLELGNLLIEPLNFLPEELDRLSLRGPRPVRHRRHRRARAVRQGSPASFEHIRGVPRPCARPRTPGSLHRRLRWLLRPLGQPLEDLVCARRIVGADRHALQRERQVGGESSQHCAIVRLQRQAGMRAFNHGQLAQHLSDPGFRRDGRCGRRRLGVRRRRCAGRFRPRADPRGGPALRTETLERVLRCARGRRGLLTATCWGAGCHRSCAR